MDSDADEEPVDSGCGCRSDGALAHISCRAKNAVAQQGQRGLAPWIKCQTCGQNFTGPMRVGLGEAMMRETVCAQTEGSVLHLLAAQNLADCRCDEGRYEEAERLNWDALCALKARLGIESPLTRLCAHRLAGVLSFRGDHAGAERIQRELLVASERARGKEHFMTLLHAEHLALALVAQGRPKEAVGMLHDVLAVRTRLSGEKAAKTLQTQVHLAVARLHDGGDVAVGQRALQNALDGLTLVLGSGHPATRKCAYQLQLLRCPASHAEHLEAAALTANTKTSEMPRCEP
jgi:hypothetical protein